MICWQMGAAVNATGSCLAASIYMELTGQKPHYFEGHAVASRNFFRGLQIVAERHGLDYDIVNYFELNPGGMVCFRNTRLYIHMESMTPGYDPKRCLMNLEFHEGEREADLFVCHPGYLDAYVLKESSLTVPKNHGGGSSMQ